MQIGELVLLPAVRRAFPERFIIADGFSCRQQIHHGTGRSAMHPVEVMALALEARGSLPQTVPERRYLESVAKPSRGVAVAGLATGLGAALSLVLAWRGSASLGRGVARR